MEILALTPTSKLNFISRFNIFSVGLIIIINLESTKTIIEMQVEGIRKKIEGLIVRDQV